MSDILRRYIVTDRNGLPWSTARKSKTVAIRFASTLTLLASASAKIKHVIHVVLLEKRCWTTHWTKSREIIPIQATLVAQWCHQSWAQSCHFSSNTASLRTFRTLLKAYSIEVPTIQISSENDEKIGEVVSASALAWTQAQQNSPDFCLASKLPSGTRRCWIGKNRLAILCD